MRKIWGGKNRNNEKLETLGAVTHTHTHTHTSII